MSKVTKYREERGDAACLHRNSGELVGVCLTLHVVLLKLMVMKCKSMYRKVLCTGSWVFRDLFPACDRCEEA